MCHSQPQPGRALTHWAPEILLARSKSESAIVKPQSQVMQIFLHGYFRYTGFLWPPGVFFLFFLPTGFVINSVMAGSEQVKHITIHPSLCKEVEGRQVKLPRPTFRSVPRPECDHAALFSRNYRQAHLALCIHDLRA